jgi:hypothetical protein
MFWTGSMPKSTRTLEILTIYCDSCSASAARSPSILSTHTWALSSSINKSCPSGGCRTHSSSSYNIASCTSRFISYMQRRIWHSSNTRPRSVSCLDRELEARPWEKKSHWTVSA